MSAREASDTRHLTTGPCKPQRGIGMPSIVAIVPRLSNVDEFTWLAAGTNRGLYGCFVRLESSYFMEY